MVAERDGHAIARISPGATFGEFLEKRKGRGVFPQIAGSYRGSNFSKGGIVLANWPTSGCCSECCAGCCPGCCCGCCPGCSGSCLPLGGVRVLSRVLCRGAVQGAPDHVCHWVV